jgi:hypothetical protein
MKSRLLAVPTVVVLLLLATVGVANAEWTVGGSGGGQARAAVLAPPTGLAASQSCTPTSSEQLATVAFRASSSATGSGTVTVAAPAGVQPGDVLVAAHVDQYDATPSAPASWTYRGNALHSTANSLSVAIYTRVVTQAEPATYSWSATAGPAAVIVTAYSGVDATTPVPPGALSTGTSTSISAPSITPPTAPTRFFGIFAIRAAATVEGPASMTSRVAATGTDGTSATPVTVLLADEAIETASATSTRTATSSVAGNNIGVLLPLKPATLGTVTWKGATGGTGSTAVSLTSPTGVVTGDLLLVGVGKRIGSPATIDTPAGWTRIRLSDVVSDQYQQTIFWRIATSSDPGGTSYSFTSTTTQASVAVMSVYRGVDREAPILVDSGLPAAASTSIVAPTVTPGRADAKLVGLFGGQGSTSLPVTPSVMQSRNSSGVTNGNNASKIALTVADEPLESSAATGDRTATTSSSNVVGQLVALKAESYPLADLTWTPTASTYADGYDLDLYRDSTTLVSSATPSPRTANSYTTDTLIAGSTYRVELRSRAADWRSSYVVLSFTIAALSC